MTPSHPNRKGEGTMDSMGPYMTHRGSNAQFQRTHSLKRSHSDMQISQPSSRWVDYGYYVDNILRIPSNTTEDEVDRKLRKTADELRLTALHISTNVESVTSSMSATTIASCPTTKSSTLSQSTAPTSCSSSEVRPMTTSTRKPDAISEHLSDYIPSTLSEIEKKRRNTGFRNGFRRMTGFSKKKKSATSPSLASINSHSDLDSSMNGDERSPILGVKSPSLASKDSSGLWSRRLSATDKSSYEHESPLIDHDALRRSMECKEMISLRARQLEERQRFLDYQMELVSKIRTERDAAKSYKRLMQEKIVDEQRAKNDKAVEDLESRHLEDESKMEKEHSTEKRTIMARLRHMEAYCQTPSPPQTASGFMSAASVSAPGSPLSTRGSDDGVDTIFVPIVIPERRITDKDYHSLAQSYRERDAMASLHASKINVLRGKQQRAVENFILKREREVEKLEAEQQRELDGVDFEFGKQEAECRSEFDLLRRRLENRWRLQAKIERKKRQDATGLQFESLPDVLCVDNCSVELMLRPATMSAREPRDFQNRGIGIIAVR